MSFWAIQNLFFIKPALAANVGNFTVSVWVDPTNSIASKALITKAEELRLVTDGNGKPLCQTKTTAWQSSVTGANALSLGTWYHVVCTYDLTNIKIYVNGVQTGSTALTAVPDDTSNVFYAGRDASSGSTYGYFQGTMDEYKFYNYALNANEIKVEYNQGKGIVMGALSANPDGSASNSAARAYCPPGSSETNCAGTGVLNASPVGEWKFDENTGTAANDSSGNNNTGTLTNGPQWTISGKIGSALKFNGVNDYVSIADNDKLDLTSDVTIEAWIKINSHHDYNPIVQRNTSSYGIYCYASGKCGFGKIGVDEVQTATVLTTGVWYHIVGVRTGGQDGIYLNGVIDAPFATKADFNALSDAIKIGGNYVTTYFNGTIDEVRIYNYARSQAQVAWDYNRGRPAGWWKMDENTGTTAHDASGNSNNGTLIGEPQMPVWTYRMPLTVSNSGSTLTDYQASVSANTYPLITAGKMQSNCADVRFVDSDNTTQLSYWLESNCNNPTTGAVFWVKIPSIPTSKTIYMYYGNAGAGVGSSGANTFDFFDDFSGDLSKWDLTQSTTGNIQIINGEVRMVGNAVWTTNGIFSKTTVIAPFVLEGQVRVPAVDNIHTTFGLGNSIATSPLVSGLNFYYAQSPTNGFAIYRDGAGDTFGNYGSGINDNFKFIIKNVGYSLYRDGILIGPDDTTWSQVSNNKIAIVKFSPATYSYIDNVRVRKYAASEPSVAPGSETAGSFSWVWTGGKFNQALTFDGVDDYVQITDTSSLRFNSSNQDYSLFAWVKRTTTGIEYIMSKEDADNDGWRLMFNSGNQVVCSENATDVTSASAITDTNWHHIGCVIDRDGNGQVYIDGRADGSAVSMGSDAMATTSNILIGVRSYTSTNYFNGLIDDVRVYNYTLTPIQIKLLYNGDSAVRFGPLTGSP